MNLFMNKYSNEISGFSSRGEGGKPVWVKRNRPGLRPRNRLVAGKVNSFLVSWISQGKRIDVKNYLEESQSA